MHSLFKMVIFKTLIDEGQNIQMPKQLLYIWVAALETAVVSVAEANDANDNVCIFPNTFVVKSVSDGVYTRNRSEASSA